jgi:hypothetical protein
MFLIDHSLWKKENNLVLTKSKINYLSRDVSHITHISMVRMKMFLSKKFFRNTLEQLLLGKEKMFNNSNN